MGFPIFQFHGHTVGQFVLNIDFKASEVLVAATRIVAYLKLTSREVTVDHQSIMLNMVN